MSTFSATALLLLTLSIGISVTARSSHDNVGWRLRLSRAGAYNGRLTLLWHYRWSWTLPPSLHTDTTATTPAALQCTGNKVRVPCGDMHNTDVNRLCPMYEVLSYRGGKPRCSAEDEQRGVMCACTAPNRMDTWTRGGGTCMPIEQCPTCPANKRFTECMARCQPSCASPQGPRRCTRSCASGCVCASGYLRHRGECVPRHMCPVAANPCARHQCAPCHRCKVNVVGEPKCVYKRTCYGEFPRGCSRDQKTRCLTFLPLCRGANCASGYSCVANYCECRAVYYDSKLNEVSTCMPATTKVPPMPTVAPGDVCASHNCAPCHKCTVNVVGEPKCVYDKRTCSDQFPYRGCPPGQYKCYTRRALCSHTRCASGFTCVANYCECNAMYYDALLNQVDTCNP